MSDITQGIIQTEKPAAADYVGEKAIPGASPEDPPGGFLNGEIEVSLNAQVESDLNVTEDDLVEAHDLATKWTLDDVRPLMEKVLVIHENDPNFPLSIISRIKAFLGNDDIAENPENYSVLIEEMKLEAALITVNSPYAEVRAVVDNHDDENTPCGTIRAWAIGLGFVLVLAFINQLFSIRQPAITVQANVAQLLAYPLGKACEKMLPDMGFTLWGVRHSLNPGPFSKKEQMLVTILANVAWNTPYTNNIIWVQYLGHYFNQPFAGQFLYQILMALSTNFIGYGLAGLVRRFLVYPSYCIWPASLVTVALNAAFHSGKNTPVQTPWGKFFRTSQLRFFGLSFAAMFVYFWFPNYIFTALSMFSWLSWIAPNNLNLSTITGFNNGLGINPWPTWDWNIMLFDATDPLVVPFFSGQYDYAAFLSSFLRPQMLMSLHFRRNSKKVEIGYHDVHDRLMARYAEAPEWWYMLVLAIAIAFGCVGVTAWETNSSPGVVFFGIMLCALFLVPVGIIKAMTGIEVTLNVLIEFLGGAWVNGNAMSMNFFKCFGYVTCTHAIWFSNDLKLAHYAKIPPRQTFAAQMIGTLLSTFICVGVLNFQMTQIPDVCTENAPNRFTCPHINTFFTASVLWGTIGPVRVFGSNGMYTWLLAGFPIGVAVPIIFYYLNKTSKKTWVRQIHPVALFYGAVMWCPYNISYIWPAVPIGWYSWVYLKRHYLSFWSKYNFVLSASFSSAIAIAAIVIFFLLQLPEIELNWWGNEIVERGCEGEPCLLKTIAEGEYFGPRIGEFR
ncbi:hypothetical protein DL769_001123 [Monosporascus sp. CRB-8-3]|nr:hypothetical protein DL769_001123 [Monosporascus sp. CRB-8-3]